MSSLGLVARWSRTFGYISVHDPILEEWWDIPTAEAPDWAKRECFKRRELYKAGNRKAYTLTRAQMEEIWQKEEVAMWSHPAITDKGIFYEDYAGEAELEEEE